MKGGRKKGDGQADGRTKLRCLLILATLNFSLSLADRRYADDVSMNREMAEVERWNDPAAQFLSVSAVVSLGAASCGV